MSLSAFLRLGIGRVVELAGRGELPPDVLWVAFRGAWRYAEAVARGDEADDVQQAVRIARCCHCPALDQSSTSKAGVVALWCGTRLDESNGTCGCLVGLTINGQTQAAGKTRVGSEQCPRGKWT
jgi:hypothetical protein